MKTEVNNLMFKHIHTNKMGLCNSRKHMPLSRKGFFSVGLRKTMELMVIKGIICASSSFVSCVQNSFNIIRETSFFGSVGLTGYVLRCDLPDAKVLQYDEDIYIFVLICNSIIYIRSVWKRHNYKNKVYFKCVRYDYDMRTMVLCLNFMDQVL